MNSKIVCKDVWKKYHRNNAVGVKEFILRGGNKNIHGSRFDREWALSEITFSVRSGEAFGIIGPNGTGKSTLLSLILGTILADQGTIKTSGRIASLLELGAGFHGDLTGRQNILLHGVILGMTRQEIQQLTPAIIEFSEIQTAIDEPIRSYSSGMIARLGFSIIINSATDILLIDEVLAVGDARFQKKCIRHLNDFKRQGGTIVVVSHDMPELASICDTGICVSMGKIVKRGPIGDIVRYYDQMEY